MMAAVPKPDYIFDRVSEWQALSEFATDERQGATLGVVSGRRRQGKTLLLESMCEELDGLYFTVPEDMPATEHLRRLAEAMAGFTGGLPPRLDSWDDAIDALFMLGKDRPTLVVLDEFPYMARSTDGLPSIIQHALSPRGMARTQSRTRLILCGSSITFMSQLMSGSAALFGRARLSMMVQAFDFRMAAQYWGVDHDLRLAAALFAVTGGTPAYIEYASGVPQSLDEFDGWVTRNLLNSNNMLFRQPRMLLSEDSSFSHIGMYGTVLTAIAEGSHTVSTIASRVGKSAADINHYVKGLLDGGFLWHCEDAFKDKRAEYQIADPLVRFHHAIVYPNWARLEPYRPQRAERLWASSRPVFTSQVVGPSFEQMCRAWTEEFADPDETLGGIPASVAQAVLSDRMGRSQVQLDLVVKDSRREVLAIGEVKSGETMTTRHLTRLREAAELLRAQHKIPEDAQPRLLLFSGAGFTPELTEAEAASDRTVQLIGLDRLYVGS
jgi:AAA+ ATPase superfamily predicted ATPase